MREFTTILTEMTSKSVTAETAVRNLECLPNMPTSKWFLNMVHSISEDNAWAFGDSIMRHTVESSKKSGMLRGARTYVAIDKDLISRYDKDVTSLIRSKRKKGTGKFETYAAVQAVAGKINAVVDCFRFVDGDHNTDFVHKFGHILASRSIYPRFVLLDREFYAVDIMSELDGMNLKFLMPAKKNTGILAAMEEYHRRRRKAVSQYTITNKDGKTFTFTPIIKKAHNKSEDNESGKKKKSKQIPISEKYIAFATNVPVQQALREINQIPKEYRKRGEVSRLHIGRSRRSGRGPQAQTRCTA